MRKSPDGRRSECVEEFSLQEESTEIRGALAVRKLVKTKSQCGVIVTDSAVYLGSLHDRRPQNLSKTLCICIFMCFFLDRRLPTLVR